MKPIQKTGSLKLHKETLRTLSATELEAVNGASAGGNHCVSDYCTSITNTIGPISIPGLGCGQPIVTSGVFDPNQSHVIVRP